MSPTDQRAAALANGVARRQDMARVRRDLQALTTRDARQLLAQLIRNPDATTGAFTIRRLLRSAPRCGAEWTDRVLAHTAIRDKHIRDLTPSQREALAVAVTLPAGAFRATGPRFRAVIAATPAAIDAAAAALRPYCASPVTHAAARAALEAAAAAGSEGPQRLRPAVSGP